jgi:hypothetical protein
VPAPLRRKIKAATAEVTAEECGEPDYEPFFEIKWTKENRLHQIECFAEWLEDFDPALGPIHE